MRTNGCLFSLATARSLIISGSAVAQSSRTCAIRIGLASRRMYFGTGHSSTISVRVARHDLDRGRSGLLADHRFKVWAAVVLRPVRCVDAIVNRPLDWHE